MANTLTVLAVFSRSKSVINSCLPGLWIVHFTNALYRYRLLATLYVGAMLLARTVLAPGHAPIEILEIDAREGLMQNWSLPVLQFHAKAAVREQILIQINRRLKPVLALNSCT